MKSSPSAALARHEDGGPLTANLLDCALPTAATVAAVGIVRRQTPSPVTPLGAADIALPLTPERVRQILQRPGRSLGSPQ